MDGVLSLDATDKQLSELAGVVATATAAMVEHIAEVIDADVLGPTGFTSVEHWVTVRTGVSYPHARRLVAGRCQMVCVRGSGLFLTGEH